MVARDTLKGNRFYRIKTCETSKYVLNNPAVSRTLCAKLANHFENGRLEKFF